MFEIMSRLIPEDTWLAVAAVGLYLVLAAIVVLTAAMFAGNQIRTPRPPAGR